MLMPDMECTRCAGNGVFISERIGRSVRCSCAAGRQLAAAEITSSMVQVAALLKRKEARR